MKVLNKPDYQVSVYSWCADIGDKAQEQIDHLAQLPFAHHHVSIMPDCHMGYGMPIGGVLATKNVIIPNAVGVDIGCGICARKTSIHVEDLDQKRIKSIMVAIHAAVPLGFHHHNDKQDAALMPELEIPANGVVAKEYERAMYQLGTLGGGNHFIELQKDEAGMAWIMIHSGSRNFGLKIAQHYNEIAIALNKSWFSSIPENWELAFLPDDSEAGRNYITEMDYAVAFALANRKLMMQRVSQCLYDAIPCAPFDDPINIAHNYASSERHYGKDVWVHRKGATQASTDTVGIIPGSQGTASYIVEGLGNQESFESCSHGAGRRMGRKDAERRLNLAEEIKRLDDQGIVHAVRSVQNLDEAAGAYKDINAVMEQQQDLVKIKTKLLPIAVIKGN